MARLQGRREDECALCGDEIGIGQCGSCGEILCKDCRMDHDCVADDPLDRGVVFAKPKGMKGGNP